MEPFFGGGAVFFVIPEGTRSIVNDVNPEITNFYEVVRDTPEQLMKALDMMGKQYSEEFYYEVRLTNPRSRIQKAARTLFLNKTCFNGLYRLNSKGQFNVPFGKRDSLPKLYDERNLLDVSRKLKATTIRNSDFEKVINEARAGDFVYCDPPYEPLSASSSFNAYTGRVFTKQDQIRLFEACNRAAKRGAKVAISNSSSPFVKKLFQDWDIVSISSRRSINSNGNRRGVIQEILAKSY
ncbi:MAG: Dam family site-specific DNA-(adenine-N6)-methyltransferase [Proteobacteria bacterium]|nr:Dam family site-specific DNA-(adenine-N6)-methyltransferase [Pseudomonadota bacterium]